MSDTTGPESHKGPRAARNIRLVAHSLRRLADQLDGVDAECEPWDGEGFWRIGRTEANAASLEIHGKILSLLAGVGGAFDEAAEYRRKFAFEHAAHLETRRELEALKGIPTHRADDTTRPESIPIGEDPP